MKLQLVALGCLVVMSEGAFAEESCEDLKMELSRGLQWESTTTWRNLMTLTTNARKCDRDDDGALDVAEFSGCLHQLLNVERKLSDDALSEKYACLEKFRSEADKNENDVVDFGEYLRWSSEWASRCSCCCCCCARDDAEEVPIEASGVETLIDSQEQERKCRCCCCCCHQTTQSPTTGEAPE